MTAKSAEVALVQHSSNLAAVEDFEKILTGQKAADQIVSDPDEVSRQIVLQLLAAESDEELGMENATPWQDLAGIPVEIHGFRWLESAYDQGAPVFAVVDGFRMDNGDRCVLTTGGMNILAQLANLAKRDRFPSIWKLEISEKQTARGFNPLWLVKATKEEEDLARSMADPSNPLDED